MSTQGDYLSGIADAIRAKEGSSDPIPADTFAERIAQITTGYDTADATAGAAQILAPYTAYGASGKVTGTIPTQQGKTITPGTSQQTAISAGNYAAGNVVVQGDANLIPGNIRSGVSIFGVLGNLEPGTLKYLTMRNSNGIRFTVPVNLTGKAFWLVQDYPQASAIRLSEGLPTVVGLCSTGDGVIYEAYIEEDPLNDGFVYTSRRVSDAQMTGDSGSNQTSFVLRTGLGFADYITLFYEDN